MSPMRIIILLVAAIAAAGAAFLVRNMAPEPAPVAPVETGEQPAPITITEVIEVPQTPVLVLTQDVPVGRLLSAVDFEWKEWPDATLNVNYYTQDIFPTAIEDLSGSVVRTAMVQNEPVLPSKIVQKGETGYMAALLTPGMRAVSVEISVDNASGGFILPGDRVDVMITYDLIMGKDEFGEEIVRPTTTTIMENVRILAIDQIFSDDTAGQFAIGSTATVELYPDQARLLVLADRLGKVTMALRSIQDAVEGGPTLARTDFLLNVGPFQEGVGQQKGAVRVFRQGGVSLEAPEES